MPDKKNIIEVASANKDFSTLVKALKAAGLAETLMGKGPFTVFAPNDMAFSKLPKGKLEELLKDKKELANILTYHVVSGNFASGDLPKEKDVKTVQGESLHVGIKEGKGTHVNDSNVTMADITASNGVIHVIDKVLMPA